jgi:hypothetical protein
VTFGWALYLIGIILMAKFLTHLAFNSQIDKDLVQSQKKDTIIVNLLESTYSMSIIIDSKFIGIILFLVANISTGIVNLNLNTKVFDTFYSLVLLHVHSLIFVLISFFIYKRFNKKRKIDNFNRMEI